MSEETSTVSARAMALSWIALVLVAVLPYLHTLDAPFHLDDYRNIVEEESIHMDHISLESLLQAAQGTGGMSRSLAKISFALNYRFHGLDVTGFHVVNIATHVLNALLVFSFLLSLLTFPGPVAWGREKAFRIALIASMLWAAHPIAIQAVTYVDQRVTSMMALFYLGALRLYMAARRSNRRGWKAALFSGVIILWILSLGTKENAAFGPAAVLLLELIFIREFSIKQTITLFVRFILLTLFAVLLWFALAQMNHEGRSLSDLLLGDYRLVDFTLRERIFTQFRVIFLYLSLLVYPHPSRLNIDHDFMTSMSLIKPWTTFAAVVTVEWGLMFAVVGARRWPLTAFSILWFVGHLLIESTIIPLEMVFEHRLYLPSIGYCLFLACVLDRLAGFIPLWAKAKTAKLLALSIPLLLCYEGWTYQRNVVWLDELSLWQDAARKSPNKSRPLNNLANLYGQMGQYDRAISKYRRIIELEPGYARAHNNLATVFFKKGRYREAIQEYRIAIQLEPGYAEAWFNLALVYLKAERRGDALAALEKYRELRPGELSEERREQILQGHGVLFTD